MGAQCATPSPTTPTEFQFQKTPSIPAFLDIELHDEGVAVATLPGTEFTGEIGDETPSPFASYASEVDRSEEVEAVTPRMAACGLPPATGLKEEDIRQTLQTTLADRGMVLTPRDVAIQEVLCTTSKSTICAADWKGQMVVIKRIKHGLDLQDKQAKLTHAMSLKEMMQELQILMALDHPCVVRLLGANLSPDQEPMLVTEYMEGGDVENYMFLHRRSAPGHRFKPSLALALRWSISVAEALTYLHGLHRPIIHRDLKPLNLLLSKDLQVKITDFGISKVMPPRGGKDASPAPMTGGVGTWRYMAPEVVRNEAYTDRVDIFSFSLIVYFLFTGRPPFHSFCGPHPERILEAYLAGQEPRPQLDLIASPALKFLKPFLEDAWDPSAAARPSAAECAVRLHAMGSQGLLNAMQFRVRSMLAWKRAVTQ
ncbi:STY13 [Symbiodinium natans]|uniref:STY13 protein n=1 Tax=Symbiodinium natans TaxID=878477 RepID=A0A812KL41_9DINO|nr:STY13 [Symbiodinium natans]